MLEGDIMFCRNTWEGMQLSQLLIQHKKAFWKSQCLKLTQTTKSGKGKRVQQTEGIAHMEIFREGST